MYIDGVGKWVSGIDDWSYKSERYYGDDGLTRMLREDRILGGRTSHGLAF